MEKEDLAATHAATPLGWEVTSLDVDPKASPTICADICSCKPLPKFAPGYFDMIWASPVCTEYSRVLTRRPRRLEEGDRLVLRTLHLIQELQPRFWKTRPQACSSSAPSWLACLGGMSAIAPTATPIASSPGSGTTWTGCPSNPCVALAVTAVSDPEGLVAIPK